MTTPDQPPLGRLLVGWLFVLLCMTGFGIVAWKGFGFNHYVRIGAGAVAVLLFAVQQLLNRWDPGGGVRVFVAATMAGGAVAAAWFGLPPGQLREAPHEPGDASPSSSHSSAPRPASSAAPTPSGHSDGTEPARTPDTPDYSRLPHGKRYPCDGELRTEASLATVKSSFSPSKWRSAMFEALNIRYPSASKLLKGLTDPQHFDVWFQQSDRQSFEAGLSALPTAVHEGMHLIDIMQRRGNTFTYELSQNEKLKPTVPTTFNRDELVAVLPETVRSMSYTNTYLTGASGAQGFALVLDELNAYTYSMLTAVAFADQLPSNRSISSRDGLMTFIFYVEAYLKLAREKHPKDYVSMLAAPGLSRAIVTLNDRAECALSLSAGNAQLGIVDAQLWPYVFGAQQLGEVNRLRDR